MMGDLKHQLNLLAVSVIIAVAFFISFAAVVAMDRLAYQLSAARILSDLGWIRHKVDETHRILKNTGVETLKSYLDNAQQEIIQEFRDFRIGDTGRLYLISDAGRILSAPSDRKATDLGGPALELVIRKKVGHAKLMIAGSPSIVYFDTFPEWRWRILLVISEKEINAERNSFILIAILILFLSAGAGVFVFARVANRFVLPILELAEKLSGMKEDQLGQQLEVKHRSNEVGILLTTFHRLSDRLLTAKKALQDKNEELQRREESLQSQNNDLILAESMLRASEEQYRLLVNNLASGIVVHAPDSSIIFTNHMALTLLGLTKEQIRGKTAIDPAWCFVRETGAPMTLEEYPVNQVLSSGSPVSHFVVGIVHTDSSDPLWVLCNAYPVSDAKGKLQQIVVLFSDISRLKQAEDALNKRLVALTQPFENTAISFDDLFNIADVQRLQDDFAKATGVASIITDLDGAPLTAPSNFSRLCNDIILKSEEGCANCFKSDAALGRHNSDGHIIQPCLSGGLWDAGAGITVGGQHIANWLIGQVRDETQTEEAMTAYAREIGADETMFIEAFREVPAMSQLQFEQVAKTLFTLANQLSTTAYQNVQQARFINERKLAEEAVRESEQTLRDIFESTLSGYWDWNLVDNTEYFSPTFKRMFGYEDHEMENSPEAWQKIIFPEDLPGVLEVFDRHVKSRGQEPFYNEIRYRHRDGSTVWVICAGRIVKWAADGTPIRMVGCHVDITRRMQAEEEKYKLESQLQQAQKMESVGRLAGGVAHDFNNMLSVILGHAELGLMKIAPYDPLAADLKEISKTAERSADLTRQLLAFARKQTIMPKVIDLNDTVTNMLKMLQRLIGENIHLTWKPSPELCQVKMDPSQIDQILANLCVNARDAIEDTGRVSIETGACAIDANYCASNPEASPGEYVRLVVSDSGKGMNKETLTRIFEPFYTTKEMGKGTGLGLATVYGAVKQNNGFINIYSEPGKGTTFSIYLPRETNTDTASRPDDAETAVPRGQETILLVEDEAAILNIAAIMLEKQGYTVLRAGSPGRAMELARERHGAIHLLMTDVIMPEMNGRDLAKNILALHPGMKRLFMSGYTADVITHHGVLDEGVHFIQKPFSQPNMAAKVREVLDA